MPTHDYLLEAPPSDEQRRELWIQNAAGFILFEDVRRYALDRLDLSLEPDARQAAEKAVDDALYGLMMVLDGVSGGLRARDGSSYVAIRATVQLREAGATTTELDLAHGDGMCMGYHMWLEGDFGTDPVARPR